MGAFIKKITAKKCPVHVAILEEMKRALEKDGYFSKEQILRRTGMGAMEDSIRWDYLRDFVCEDADCDTDELVPLAKRFFSKEGTNLSWADTDPEERKLYPQRFMASGHGKKTYGYAAVTFADGKFATKKLANMKGVKNGVSKAFDQYLEKLRKRDLLDEKTMRLISQ